jgi:hypothetical protein
MASASEGAALPPLFAVCDAHAAIDLASRAEGGVSAM